jgi:hypothetical protein
MENSVLNSLTKETWRAKPLPDKVNIMSEVLQELYDIDKGKHKLHGSNEAGGLCNVKKYLENFISKTLEWEQDN